MAKGDTTRSTVSNPHTGRYTPPMTVQGALVHRHEQTLKAGVHEWVTLSPSDAEEDSRLWEFCLHCGRILQTME